MEKSFDGQFISLRTTANQQSVTSRTGGVLAAIMLLAALALFIKVKMVRWKGEKHLLLI